MEHSRTFQNQPTSTEVPPNMDPPFEAKNGQKLLYLGTAKKKKTGSVSEGILA